MKLNIVAYQILYFLGVLLTAPFGPVLIRQGRRVRAAVPALPEAGGPRKGVAGEGGEPLRLLALGESTIAGVGVDNHERGFTGYLARFLHQATGRRVEWQVLARSGYTARDAKDHLTPLLPAYPLGLIVVGLGGNDTFKLNSPLRWRSDMIQLLRAIREKQPDAPILVINLPPVGHFPAFPASLQVTLGTLVRLLGKAIRDIPTLFERAYYMSSPVFLKDWEEKSPPGMKAAEAFFSDGVHPSGLTYGLWAEDVGAFIAERRIL